jgi:probable F420-dependent oxidoreductase
VLVLPVHDPVRLAKSLATLDHMSAGRVTVGVGLGSSRREFDAIGRAFSERAARTEETIRALRALWTSDPCTFEGRWLSLREQSFHPKPVQQPHPPIFVGGGVRTSVARAAALGDGWLPMSATLAELEAGIAELHRELRSRGRATAGFPIANKLPAHETSARTARHARRSGASAVPALNGDPARVQAYVEEAEGLGVTHLWVELPAGDRLRQAEGMARVLGLS